MPRFVRYFARSKEEIWAADAELGALHLMQCRDSLWCTRYLCPRTMKQKLNIDPDSLIPTLPKPQELRPFPERKSFSFEVPLSAAAWPLLIPHIRP